MVLFPFPFFFFSSRRRHTRWPRDWSSDVCSSDLEPHDLPLRVPFRIKIRSPFPAAEGQPGQAVFESLLKRKKLYDTQIHRWMKSQTSFVGAESTVKLHPVPSVYSVVALIIYPGDPEHNHSFRFQHPLDHPGVLIL